LFSGAMGLDLGLEQSGFEVVLAVECDPQAIATIKRNRPNLAVIERRIEDVTTREILKVAGLKRGGNFVVTGGPSCQSFSTAGHRRSLSDPRGGLFHHFVRVVKEARPRFFIMENVRGMISAAVVHRPLDKRGPGNRRLKRDEELGSAFRVVARTLKRLKFYVVFDIINAADYGVPQCRERLVFLGSRDGVRIKMPPPTHSQHPEDGVKPWVTLRSAIGRFRETNPVAPRLGREEARFLNLIPAGGNWRDLPKRMQKKALGKAYLSWGGRSGFFRRLAWDKPSPALTTRPDSKATMQCHPTELRPLSVKEYSRIQQFPASWRFEGSPASQYRQIGNAVPIGLGAALGRAIRDAWRLRADRKLLGVVKAANGELVRRMADRPVTILNPPRMRKSAGRRSVLKWAILQRKQRVGANKYAACDDEVGLAA
jgi:DNA (cytosine-5)-methyltransferase 1